MATFLILCKIASIVLALRFFQVITTMKTEPNFYSFHIARFKNIFKIFFGAILIFGILSLIPFESIFGNMFKSKPQTALSIGEKPATSINKKDLTSGSGTWELEGFTHTITYYNSRKLFMKYPDSEVAGAWNITKNKLLVTLDGDTNEYQIDILTPNYYEITDLKTKQKFKATKIE